MSLFGFMKDEVSGAAVMLDLAHHEIHEGDSFSIRHVGTGKNDGETIAVYLKTPNTTKRIHAFMDWSASGAAYGIKYEAPTITAGTGVQAAVFNRERNSGNTSTVWDNTNPAVQNKVTTDPTKTGNGTIISTEFAGAAKSEGAQVRGEHEWVLKQNTAYLFVVESDAAALTLGMSLRWYEV